MVVFLLHYSAFLYGFSGNHFTGAYIMDRLGKVCADFIRQKPCPLQLALPCVSRGVEGLCDDTDVCLECVFCVRACTGRSPHCSWSVDVSIFSVVFRPCVPLPPSSLSHRCSQLLSFCAVCTLTSSCRLVEDGVESVAEEPLMSPSAPLVSALFCLGVSLSSLICFPSLASESSG